MEEVWTRPFEVDGRRLEAVFVRRPFREGLEVHVTVEGTVIRVGELGYGESSLIEKLSAQVRAYFDGLPKT